MQEGFRDANKRIAKNSLILYTKLLLNIVLGLITSRYVLQALGASDYGLYNVVAGVLTMITFISSSMSETTTRYINFELGKIDGDVNRIFNTCQIIHICLAVVLLILAETIGVYYVRNILKVSPGMEGVAMFVFQISTISSCFGITNAPYQGLIVAKENFATMAKAEIFNTILKLLFVLSLFIFSKNRLPLYSIYMVCLTLVLFAVYHWVCFTRWPEIVKWNTKGLKTNFKEILFFNNYNILASGSQLVKDQGTNILINYFYGTVVNAAYSIAFLIQSYINLFVNSIGYAAAPQITQNISCGNSARSNKITVAIGKCCLLISMIAVFPILTETEFVLGLWLGNIPPNTVEFVQHILILAIVGASSSGLVLTINATGKIKWFKISFSTLCLLSLPIILLTFKNNGSPTIALKLFIGIEIVNRIIQLILLRRISGFNSLGFIKLAYFRPLLVATIIFIEMFILHSLMSVSIPYKISNILIVLFSTIIAVYSVGFTSVEKSWINNIVKDKLR
jgi:O-antigen/teichoic acid export membrane protein